MDQTVKRYAASFESRKCLPYSEVQRASTVRFIKKAELMTPLSGWVIITLLFLQDHFLRVAIRASLKFAEVHP